MTDVDPPAAKRHRSRLALGMLVGAVLVVVIAVGTVRGTGGSSQPGPGSSAAPNTPPPYSAAPVSWVDDTMLTVPERTRFAQGTFWATADTTYLVTMDLQSTKPEGSGGRSMYLGVTLSCSPQAGGPGISVGGTQNMLTGEVTSYRNQGLISVSEDGAIDCSIKASAPYDDVASDGTTFEVGGTWRAVPADGEALAAPEKGLPRTIADGSEEIVMTVDLPVDLADDDEVRALTSLHLTTCTIVNGSREDDRAWCAKDELDEAGSTVNAKMRAELVDAGGAVCGDLGTAATGPDHIDLYRHHRLLSLELTEALPESPCGETVRLTVSVHNNGPAPLVVHRSNSSLTVVSE
ncbi:hypothetical protein [Brachybacterium sp. AOP35-5H-19]|uniref:hypothetical protein n=1 Tax=Brachybacterium sp. AOP35-5H-19 TaxID=3457685 RepID=UPI0040338DFA